MIESLLGIYPVTLWRESCAQKLGPWFCLLKDSSSSTDTFRNGGVYVIRTKIPPEFEQFYIYLHIQFHVFYAVLRSSLCVL